MENANSRTERILKLINFIRDNSGKYNSNEISEIFKTNRFMILRDLQLAGKYGFVKHDTKLKKYVFVWCSNCAHKNDKID